MSEPKILIEDLSGGRHNQHIDTSRDRLLKGATYKDQSTVIVVPTRGMIHARVVQSWLGLWLPMNQKSMRMFAWNMEVGDAYNALVEFVVNHPELKTWKYILTLEEDNIPPPDGLLKLIESIEGGISGGQKFDAVGGLYWTKGEGGQPMIYGDPRIMPKNFIPQVPWQDALQPCQGLGLGFTLMRTAMFTKGNIPKPWFKSLQEAGKGMYTQDLYFFERAGNAGFRFACDTRVKVGHYDAQTDIVW